MPSIPYIGEIMMFSAPWTPVGWIPCDGRLLEISEYELLFMLMGKNYGGDGIDNFAVPNLNGYFATGATPSFPIGSYSGVAGQCAAQITINELPSHAHGATFSGSPSTTNISATLPIKKRLSSGVSEGSINVSPGGYLGEGPSSGTPSAAIYVAGSSTADTAALAPASGTATFTPLGAVNVQSTGAGRPLNIPVPKLALQFCIAAFGIYPSVS